MICRVYRHSRFSQSLSLPLISSPQISVSRELFGSHRPAKRRGSSEAQPEIEIRATAKMGELIKEMPKQAGARGIGKKVESPRATPLSDSGITKAQSHRAVARSARLLADWFFRTESPKVAITSSTVFRGVSQLRFSRVAFSDDQSLVRITRNAAGVIVANRFSSSGRSRFVVSRSARMRAHAARISSGVGMYSFLATARISRRSKKKTRQHIAGRGYQTVLSIRRERQVSRPTRASGRSSA